MLRLVANRHASRPQGQPTQALFRRPCSTVPSAFFCPLCFFSSAATFLLPHSRTYLSLENPRPAESLGSSRRRTFQSKARENGTPGRLITRPDARPGTSKAEDRHRGAPLPSPEGWQSGMSGKRRGQANCKGRDIPLLLLDGTGRMQNDGTVATVCPGLLMLPHLVSPRLATM